MGSDRDLDTIVRHYCDGEHLDVAGLNEIIVLVDRSQTALSELGLNYWRPGLEGPPHFHDHKEQLFFVTDGKGTIVVSGERFDASRGALIYVPVGAMHRTLADPERGLEYLLFMSYKDAEKEGQATFSEHVAEAKHIRREQADRAARGVPVDWSRSPKAGQRFAIDSLDDMDSEDESQESLLDVDVTHRCAASLMRVTSSTETLLDVGGSREVVLFSLEGSGNIRVDGESIRIPARHIAYIPAGRVTTIQADEGGRLDLLCFATKLGRI